MESASVFAATSFGFESTKIGDSLRNMPGSGIESRFEPRKEVARASAPSSVWQCRPTKTPQEIRCTLVREASCFPCLRSLAQHSRAWSRQRCGCALPAVPQGELGSTHQSSAALSQEPISMASAQRWRRSRAGALSHPMLRRSPLLRAQPASSACQPLQRRGAPPEPGSAPGSACARPSQHHAPQ